MADTKTNSMMLYITSKDGNDIPVTIGRTAKWLAPHRAHHCRSKFGYCNLYRLSLHENKLKPFILNRIEKASAGNPELLPVLPFTRQVNQQVVEPSIDQSRLSEEPSRSNDQGATSEHINLSIAQEENTISGIHDSVSSFAISKKTNSFLEQRFRAPIADTRVHMSTFADAILRKNRADAMTLGSDIYVASSTAQSHEPRFQALIAHELVHAAQNAGQEHNSSNVNKDQSAGRSKEDQALAVERMVLAAPPMFSVEKAEERSQAQHSLSIPSSSTVPQFAATTRHETAPAIMPESKSSAAAFDLEHLKSEIYRDLMLRIKTEFERGA